MEQELLTLSQYYGAPAVTILLSTHRTHPDSKQDPINLKKLVTMAENQLYETYDKREVWPILDKIKSAEAEVNHEYNLDSLAIFASKDVLKIVKMPIPVTDRIVISDRFEIRPLLRALEQKEYYYVLTISRNKIRLLEAFNDTLVREVSNKDFPFENTQYYTTDHMKIIQDSYLDDLVKEYFNVADKRFKEYYYAEPLPVILLGDAKMLAYYEEQMDIKNIVIGTAHGNYDDTTPHEILKITYPIVKQHLEEKEQQALQVIDIAQSAQKLNTDFGDIYRAAQAGAADTLYIEKTYFARGTVDEEGIVDLSEDPTAEDLTLVAIDTILNKSGKVTIMNEGALEKYNGIALVTRF
ncbi:hypothetical protein DVR12_04175 [Chitinophaga silvatica]|uniref:Uncharacterized protein n=1 Tax=Chitinophaga silvatica TaxID=2282649 RepID=A0A3E1YI04_9BACT|nr:hypothetical protein [Chitinophaga silvatica]RFS26988.1 hypothetical protein DVR12_04175 [Chitinophaga silvatica]